MIKDLPALTPIAFALLLALTQPAAAASSWNCHPGPPANPWICDEGAADPAREEPTKETEAPDDAAEVPPPTRDPAQTQTPLDPQETPAAPANTPEQPEASSAKEPAPSTAPEATDRSHEPLTAPTGKTVVQRPSGYWGLCRTHYPDIPDTPADPRPLAERPIVIHADRTRTEADGSTTVEGSVVLTQGDRRIEADRIALDNATRKVTAEGALRYTEPGVRLDAERAQIQLRARRGELEEVRYTVPQRHGRGEARSARFIGRPDRRDELRLSDATYTSCDPGKEDWVLKARDLRLHRASGRAVARDILLRFMDVPVFYWPYLDFPIDNRRHTGFLIPTFGNSGSAGLDFSLPYYFNLAPNYDATLTPRFMSKRGFQAQGEFRYLLEDHEGQVNLDIVPHDTDYGSDREFFSLKQLSALSPAWSASVDYSIASDRDYLDDLGTVVDLPNSTHLLQRAEMRYEQPDWSLVGRVQGYQTLDRDIARVDFPHERVPQVVFSGILPAHPAGLELGLRSEYTRFAHSTAPEGERIDLEPRISLPLSGASWFFTPAVKYRYTHYELEQAAAGVDTHPTRTLPVYSLDAGLFFERPLERWGHRYTQTLEPRLYYLYVPDEAQQEIPLFDSAALDFSFDQLFRDNRYSGRDRVGDAHQLTLALSSRLLDQADGRERLRASAGALLYFRDQKVSLDPGEFITEEGTTDWVGELDYRIQDDWSARTGVEWNSAVNDLRQATLQLHYQPDRAHIVNLAYRERRDLGEPLRQTDVSLYWPMSRRWSAVSRWDYSLEDHRTLDAFLGFEYGSCCWALRVLARHYVDDVDTENNAVYVQVVLRGLTQVGQSIGGLLEHGILGYSPETEEIP